MARSSETRRDFVKATAAAAFGAPMVNRARFQLFAWSRTEYSARCIALLQRATVVDMLSPLTLNFPLQTKWSANPETFGEADFARFRSSGINVFHVGSGFGGPDAYQYGLTYFLGWNALIAGRGEYFIRIDSPGDLDRIKATGKIGVMLGAQNSDHFQRPEHVAEFYGYGQRVSQLTYNSRNRIGNGSTERGDDGISDFGVTIIERMNAVGMAVDVSHCADKTSSDAFDISKKPVLITHSNARALNPGHPRCKPDDVIKKVGATGSVMGISGVRNFVTAKEPTTIEHLLDHFDYIGKLIGIEHVGIGSDIDLDGYDDMPPEILKALKASYKGSYAFRDKGDIDEVAHPKRMFDLTDGLIRRGYSDDQILGIVGGNFRRVLREIWTV